MDIEEIRLECIRLAQNQNIAKKAVDVVESARTFETFVTEQGSKHSEKES